MKIYEDMTFDELLAYKERLINSGVWNRVSAAPLYSPLRTAIAPVK